MKENIENLERKTLIEKSKFLREEESEKEEELRKLKENRLVLHKQVPNLTHPDVPSGFTDKDNVPIKEVGLKREFDFQPKNLLFAFQQNYVFVFHSHKTSYHQNQQQQ